MVLMKILHICLAGIFTDGWSYQENLLSKYHVKLGNDVTLIASNLVYDKTGKKAFTQNTVYINDDGVKIVRLKEKRDKPERKLRRFPQLFDTIVEEKPDIIFVHGCQFLDIDIIIKYKELHKNTLIYVDNHADFSNSARNWISYHLLHKILWKRCAQKLVPYTEKFYGVMPARVDFLINMYGIPKEKVELLVMGTDDEKVFEARKQVVREQIRKKHNIEENDFLIVTGGKIDIAKKQTILLMQAVNKFKNTKIKLLVFGSVVDELANDVVINCSSQVQYIGWIDSDLSYNYFAAADLVVFPGRHSVFWEQVVGLGKPMVVKDWPGTHHVDVGGNVYFLKRDTCDEIYSVLNIIITNNSILLKMKSIAELEGMQQFSYYKIAQKSIGFNSDCK